MRWSCSSASTSSLWHPSLCQAWPREGGGELLLLLQGLLGKQACVRWGEAEGEHGRLQHVDQIVIKVDLVQVDWWTHLRYKLFVMEVVAKSDLSRDLISTSRDGGQLLESGHFSCIRENILENQPAREFAPPAAKTS